jgi:hypothetical protein
MELRGLRKLAAPLLRRRMQPMFQRDLNNIKTLEAAHAAPSAGPVQQHRGSEMPTMKQAARSPARSRPVPAWSETDSRWSAEDG